MQVWPRAAIGFRVGTSAMIGALVTAVTWNAWGLGALAAGLAVAALGTGTGLLRYVRRARLLASPIDPEWTRILERRVEFYRRLDEAGRRRFVDDMRVFLAEQTIVGAHGVVVDDDTRVLIGASAAMLAHGWPDYEWPRVRDIVVYPRSFDDSYGLGGDLAGMVHGQGPILLSRRDLRRGFARAHDGHNVGLHELAHVLDLRSGAADGMPADAGWMVTLPWVEVIRSRLQRVRRGDRSTLRAYAGTNEAELFAVAVEVFFEQPGRLRERDPDLYRMLSEYFAQDPAAADSA